jgi:hypothetical protein
MDGFIDHRRSERHGCRYPLFCSHLNSRKVYAARVVDYGERGLSFVSDTPFKCGMTLYFRSDLMGRNREACQSCAGMRETGLVQVRWCQPIGQEPAESYRIGAEYMQPYP